MGFPIKVTLVLVVTLIGSLSLQTHWLLNVWFPFKSLARCGRARKDQGASGIRGCGSPSQRAEAERAQFCNRRQLAGNGNPGSKKTSWLMNRVPLLAGMIHFCGFPSIRRMGVPINREVLKLLEPLWLVDGKPKENHCQFRKLDPFRK